MKNLWGSTYVLPIVHMGEIMIQGGRLTTSLLVLLILRPLKMGIYFLYYYSFKLFKLMDATSL